MSGSVLISGRDLKSQILEVLPFDQEAAVDARGLALHFPNASIDRVRKALSMLNKWPDVKRRKSIRRAGKVGWTVWEYWRVP